MCIWDWYLNDRTMARVLAPSSRGAAAGDSCHIWGARPAPQWLWLWVTFRGCWNWTQRDSCASSAPPLQPVEEAFERGLTVLSNNLSTSFRSNFPGH